MIMEREDPEVETLHATSPARSAERLKNRRIRQFWKRFNKLKPRKRRNY
jgi:hypothetical protein